MQEATKDTDQCASIILFNKYEEVLVLLRNPHLSQWMPGRWSCPGGHLVEGESTEVGAVRELFEETNLTVSPDSLLFIEKKGRVTFFTADKFHGKVTLDEYENTGYAWLSEEMLDSVNGVPDLKETVRRAKQRRENIG